VQDPRLKLVEALRASGLRQHEIAKRLGVSQTTVHCWLHHERRRRLPNQADVIKILRAFPQLLPLYLSCFLADEAKETGHDN
jgi:predicted transcriptional regulator